MSITSEMIRTKFKISDDRRDFGLRTPETVERFDDIVYGTDEKWQVLDVYRPKHCRGEKLPVIVSVHGGGWVYGDKERYQFYGMNLAERGFVVVNFTYRLAPEYKFPASLEDTNLVFTWVLAHAEQYGMDVEHIFAVGDSAGAHNLSLYAAICTNPDYAKEYAFSVPEWEDHSVFAPTAIALNCGVYEVRTDGVENEQTRKLMEDLLPQRGSAEELEKISVVNHITEQYPRTFVMTAEGDFLKKQAPLLTAKLMEHKVPFVSRLYGDSANKLGHVFHCNVKSGDAAVCNDEECGFFQNLMKR